MFVLEIVRTRSLLTYSPLNSQGSCSTRYKGKDKRLVPFNRISQRGNVLENRTAILLLRALQKISSDLVVISTHGANKAFQLIGGVTERVLRGMHCPVLLVPKDS